MSSSFRHQPGSGGRGRRSVKEEECHEMLEGLLQMEEILQRTGGSALPRQ